VEHITEEERAANDEKEKQMLKSVINVIDNLQNPEGENCYIMREKTRLLCRT
jgi:hypothetical protein